MAEFDNKVLENLRDELYGNFPDFGNFGKSEKSQSVVEVLKSRNYPIDNFPDDVREGLVSEILEKLGESKTYSFKEGAYDVGVPMAGSAVGGAIGSFAGPVGRIAGTMVGGGLAAGAGEVGKAEYERRKRGIPGQTMDEMVKTGAWTAALETAFGALGPVFEQLKLGAARKLLLPKGGVESLPSGIRMAQETLGGIPIPPNAKTRPAKTIQTILNSIRYGPGGKKASLGVEHFRSGEESVVGNFADLIGSSWAGGPFIAKRSHEALDNLNSFFMGNISDTMTPHDSYVFGKVLNRLLKGEVGAARSAKAAKWFMASKSVAGREIPVKLSKTQKYFADNLNNPALEEHMSQLDQIVNRFIELHTGTELPRMTVAHIAQAMPAELADVLWHQLNAVKSPDLKPFAQKLARTIRDDLFEGLKQHGKATGDEAPHQLYTEALRYHKHFKDTHASKMVDNMLTKASRDASTLEPLVVRGAEKLGNLMKIKEIIPKADYENFTIPSVRWKIVKDAIQESDNVSAGKYLSGTLLKKRLSNLGLEVDNGIVAPNKYLEEVFGGRKGVQALYDFAHQAEAASSGAMGNKIIMKIFEASQIVGIPRAAQTGDIKQMGQGFAMLMTPFAIATKIFGNAKVLRELTDGVSGYHPLADAAATLSRIGANEKAESSRFYSQVKNFFDEDDQIGPDVPEGIPASPSAIQLGGQMGQ